MPVRQGADLRVYVELRGFEPLTFSMRTKWSAVQVDGGLYQLVVHGDSRVRVVRAEAPADPGGFAVRRSCDGSAISIFEVGA